MVFGSVPAHVYANCATCDIGSDVTPSVGFGYGVLGASVLARSEGIRGEAHFDCGYDSEGSKCPSCDPLPFGGTGSYRILESFGLTYEGGESGHASLYVIGVAPDYLESAVAVAAGDGEVEIGLSVILRYLLKPSNFVCDGVASLASYSNGRKTDNLISSVCTLCVMSD